MLFYTKKSRNDCHQLATAHLTNNLLIFDSINKKQKY